MDYPHVEPADPFAEPPRCRRNPTGRRPPAERTAAAPAPAATPQLVRTALAVELRDGHICVFLPPLADGADYAVLIAAIEATAARPASPSASRATSRPSTRA